jgi:hypothetical protein
MEEQNFKEIMNSFVRFKWLVIAFAFAIIVSAGAVWWGYHQGEVADRHLCEFADASRRSQIATASDAAAALASIVANNDLEELGVPEEERFRILGQLNQYVSGQLKEIPSNLHPEIQEVFTLGRDYARDASGRVERRLPAVETYAPLCKGVASGQSKVPPMTAQIVWPSKP